MQDPYVIMTIVIAVAIIVGFFVWQRERGGRLQTKYGREYNRAVDELGKLRAERELTSREKRVRDFQLVPLTREQRNRFVTSWRMVQEQFVDDPEGAVAQGDRLVEDVIDARGYPIADFDQRIADLSVHHSHIVDHYRALRAIGHHHGRREASTEDLRQALVHFRAVFEDLLEDREHQVERVVEVPVERDDVRVTRTGEPLRRPTSELRP
jgi:hypothetical protein